MGLFRKRIFFWDAAQHVCKFLEANGAETLEFVCARMDTKLILDQTGFELRKEIFPDSWAYGAFSFAALFNDKDARDLAEYGKGKTGWNFDKAQFDSFVSRHRDISHNVNARYEMIRLLFLCHFNKHDLGTSTKETFNAAGLDVHGKVHAEFLTCARYVMHISKQFKIVYK
jgi:hypothetical protein